LVKVVLEQHATVACVVLYARLSAKRSHIEDVPLLACFLPGLVVVCYG